MDNAVGGLFTFKQVVIAWHFEGLTWGNRCTEGVLEVELGDVGVIRRFATHLTREQAEAEANRIVPELFRIAEAWGEVASGRDARH
jgi:hypothetical protein